MTDGVGVDGDVCNGDEFVAVLEIDGGGNGGGGPVGDVGIGVRALPIAAGIIVSGFRTGTDKSPLLGINVCGTIGTVPVGGIC